MATSDELLQAYLNACQRHLDEVNRYVRVVPLGADLGPRPERFTVEALAQVRDLHEAVDRAHQVWFDSLHAEY